jgi:hypothetical protein
VSIPPGTRTQCSRMRRVLFAFVLFAAAVTTRR